MTIERFLEQKKAKVKKMQMSEKKANFFSQEK